MKDSTFAKEIRRLLSAVFSTINSSLGAWEWLTPCSSSSKGAIHSEAPEQQAAFARLLGALLYAPLLAYLTAETILYQDQRQPGWHWRSAYPEG